MERFYISGRTDSSPGLLSFCQLNWQVLLSEVRVAGGEECHWPEEQDLQSACDNNFQSRLLLAPVLGARFTLQGCPRAIEKDLEVDSFDTGEREGCGARIRERHNTAWNGIGT